MVSGFRRQISLLIIFEFLRPAKEVFEASRLVDVDLLMKKVALEKAVLHEIRFRFISHFSGIHDFFVEALDILFDGLPLALTNFSEEFALPGPVHLSSQLHHSIKIHYVIVWDPNIIVHFQTWRFLKQLGNGIFVDLSCKGSTVRRRAMRSG